MRRQYDKRQVERVIPQTSWAPRVTVVQPLKSTKKKDTSSFFKRIGGFFKRLFRKPAPWELKAMAAAVAKRARRRERNIRWWSNDRTWEFYSC